MVSTPNHQRSQHKDRRLTRLPRNSSTCAANVVTFSNNWNAEDGCLEKGLYTLYPGTSGSVDPALNWDLVCCMRNGVRADDREFDQSIVPQYDFIRVGNASGVDSWDFDLTERALLSMARYIPDALLTPTRV